MWKEEQGQELSMMERQRGRGKHRAAYREEVAIQIHETHEARGVLQLSHGDGEEREGSHVRG